MSEQGMEEGVFLLSDFLKSLSVLLKFSKATEMFTSKERPPSRTTHTARTTYTAQVSVRFFLHYFSCGHLFHVAHLGNAASAFAFIERSLFCTVLNTCSVWLAGWRFKVLQTICMWFCVNQEAVSPGVPRSAGNHRSHPNLLPEFYLILRQVQLPS